MLSLTRAFPDAPVYTSLYDPGGTFPEFADLDVRTMPINRIPPLRTYHRAALPLLAPSFSLLRIAADVVICSSSGWAHGARVEGRKIVYCHTPARWLYQSDRYLRGRGRALHAAAGALRSPLEHWDKRAAASADVYLANSSVVAKRIKSLYGIDADVVPPPPAVTPDGPARPIHGIEPGFVLTVSRLLPYKNVDAVMEAFQTLPDERLVVVGSGPVESGATGRSPSQRARSSARWTTTSSAGCTRTAAPSSRRRTRTLGSLRSKRPDSGSRRRHFDLADISTRLSRATRATSSRARAQSRSPRWFAPCSDARWETSTIRNAADRLLRGEVHPRHQERAR